MTILITGAPGNVGTPLVQELPPPTRRSGSLPWNPAWVGAALSGEDHLEVVRLDCSDPATWSATFAGAERMFLLRPPQLFRVGRDLLPALEAAAAGVGHVVVSPSRADATGWWPTGWSRITDAPRRWPGRSSGPATCCRIGPPPTPPRAVSALWLPTGKGCTAFVDARDVAASPPAPTPSTATRARPAS